MLLNEYWDESYWPSCGRLRECTRVGYASAWRRHIRPELGDMDLADLTGPRIQSWLDSISSPGAARKAWAVLRQMLRSAVRLGILDVDVAGRVTPPKPSGYEPEVLDIRQIRQLLQGFHGHELEAWLICSICLGLRTEEALGLEWQDLNLNTGKVRIRRGLQWVDGHEVIVDPKTELSRRTVVLPLVDSCLALRPEEGYGVDWADIDMRSGITHIQRGVQWVAGHEVVVPPKTELSDRFLPLPRFAVRRLREIRNGRKGRIIGDLTPSQAARRYASWCKKESLPYVPVQNLRHSWATNALEAGVNIAVVSKFLGHTDIKTTARFYLRPEIASLKEAQSIWERALIGQ